MFIKQQPPGAGGRGNGYIEQLSVKGLVFAQDPGLHPPGAGPPRKKGTHDRLFKKQIPHLENLCNNILLIFIFLFS